MSRLSYGSKGASEALLCLKLFTCVLLIMKLCFGFGLVAEELKLLVMVIRLGLESGIFIGSGERLFLLILRLDIKFDKCASAFISASRVSARVLSWDLHLALCIFSISRWLTLSLDLKFSFGGIWLAFAASSNCFLSA